MAKGGARPGAGRKPKLKLPFASKKQAQSAFDKLGKEYKGKQLPTIDDLWLSCLLSNIMAIRFQTLVYLTNRDEGTPMQRHMHAGDEHRPITILNKIERPSAEVTAKVD